MKRLLVIMMLLVASVAAQDKTVINDRPAATKLLGRHMFSLQWVSWDYFGTAGVTNRDGVYKIVGSQRGRGQASNDYVEINGMITAIEAKEFSFKGTITTQVSHINGGKPCVRDGEFTFVVTGARKYWRLKQMDNPCDEATDYVDIYFR